MPEPRQEDRTNTDDCVLHGVMIAFLHLIILMFNKISRDRDTVSQLSGLKLRKLAQRGSFALLQRQPASKQKYRNTVKLEFKYPVV